MISVSAHTYISASREEVYDLVSDLAVRVSFTDHYMKDYRLANPKSKGRGAAARWLQRAPLNKQYFETHVVEAERPRRIVEAVHGGRGGRTRGEIVFELSRAQTGVTRVEMTTRTDAGTPRDGLKERFGTARWLRRQMKTALERLRVILEEQPGAPLARATMAGYEPLKSARFGVSTPVFRG
jgi:Polyketide cyclase / dehydrase and lipid transport